MMGTEGRVTSPYDGYKIRWTTNIQKLPWGRKGIVTIYLILLTVCQVIHAWS